MATVDYPDLYASLIETPEEFTREKLKAFKSLEAYNYYKSGWVHTVFYYDLGTGHSSCLLKSKVNPSQRLSEKPHEPWVAVDKKSGSIVTAHCTCMAGRGLCPFGCGVTNVHIPPMCMDQAFSKKVQPSPVRTISFEQPKRNKENTIEDGEPPAKRTKPLPPPVDQHTLFNTLHKVFPSAAIFTVIPGFLRVTSPPHTEDEPNLPILLSSLYDCKYAEYTVDELSEVARCKLTDIQFTAKETELLEKSTRAQSCSSLWYDNRQGRITASMFGRVARCAERKHPTSLVKS